MTVTHLDTADLKERTLRARIDAFFAGLGQGVNCYLERHARLDEIRRLSALSDAELAARGIERDRIVHHVFRDKFHI